MPKTALTDLAIRRFPPPPKGTLTYWDTNTKGLGLRISQGGAKTFIVLIDSGQRRKIGRYPDISLQVARTEAKRKLGEVALGRIRPENIAFEDAITLFLAACEGRTSARTAKDYRYLLTRHFKWGRRQISDITPQEIARRIDALSATPGEQNHAYVALRVFMRWAVRRHFLAHNPMEAMQMPSRAVSRERVLSDTELAEVLHAAPSADYPYGHIILLLIFTGQRRGEIGGLRWEWIDTEARTIALPNSITKNRKSHTFPYGQSVADILAELPFREGYLFPAAREHVRGKPTTVFNGYQKAKNALDRNLAIEPWTLHDLRRTFSSNMAALGVAPHVTEKLLNHVSGTVSGVAAVYNRYQYLPEMRAAIALWEDKLKSLAHPG